MTDRWTSEGSADPTRDPRTLTNFHFTTGTAALTHAPSGSGLRHRSRRDEDRIPPWGEGAGQRVAPGNREDEPKGARVRYGLCRA